MRIYLAARYSRRLELCGYRDQLTKLGHEVCARWLDGSHQITAPGQTLGPEQEALVEGDAGGDSAQAIALRAKFAREDLKDVQRAQLLIAFSEPARSNYSRGGRHVEFGIALALLIPIILVGPRENLFHWLPQVKVFGTWEQTLERLGTS